MANRASPGETAHDFLAVKSACHMAHCTVRMEIMIVITSDARSLLAAMLERMEPKRHHGRGAFSVIDTKNPALLTKFVVIKRVGGQHISNPAALRWVAYRHDGALCLPLSHGCNKENVGRAFVHRLGMRNDRRKRKRIDAKPQI